MSNLAEFIRSPAAPSLIILLTFVEAAAIAAYHRRTGRGVALPRILPNLLAGDFLLLGLAVALAGGGWQWIGLALFASLICHVIDLACRWQS